VALFSRQQIVHYLPRSLPYLNSCVHFFPELNWGPCIRLVRDKDIVLRDSLGDFEGFMSLSPENIRDLNWWVDALPSADRSIDHGVPDFTLTSDASLRVWDAASGTFCTHGLWSEAETTYHINVLELLAVKLGLRSLLVDCRGQHIRVVSDNTTAVTYINGMEGKSLPSDSITGTVWSWAIDRGNWLSAGHIPGTSNVSADDLSRNFKADTEWALSNDVFPGCVVPAGCQILTFSRAGLITKTPSTLHGSQTPRFLRECFYA